MAVAARRQVQLGNSGAGRGRWPYLLAEKEPSGRRCGAVSRCGSRAGPVAVATCDREGQGGWSSVAMQGGEAMLRGQNRLRGLGGKKIARVCR